MSSKPKPVTQAERERIEHEREQREQNNHSQGLFQLPAELRNAIYEHLIATSEEYSYGQGYQYTRRHFPALLHVSQQTRADIIPMFFANIVVAVYIPNLILQNKTPCRLDTITNVLCDRSIASLRYIRLHARSLCWHDIQLGQKAANAGFVEVMIDRRDGEVAVTRLGEGCLEPFWSQCCCQMRDDCAEQLLEGIRAVGLDDPSRILRKRDFDCLGQRLGLQDAKPKWRRLWSGLRGKKV